MKQNILILFILFGGIEILFYSCCPDTDLDFTIMEDVRIFNSKVNEESTDELMDSLSVDSEDFRIGLSYHIVLTALNHPKYYSNALFAISCENEGLEGLKDKMVGFELTCNSELFGIAAGNSLVSDERVKIYVRQFFDDSKNERITIEDWKDVLNNGIHNQFYSPWHIEFQERIDSPEFLIFKIQIEFLSGERFELETNPIKIE